MGHENSYTEGMRTADNQKERKDKLRELYNRYKLFVPGDTEQEKEDKSEQKVSTKLEK